MILENNYGLLDEQEDINPFLSTPALAAEFGGGIVAGQLKKRVKSLRKSYPVALRRTKNLVNAANTNTVSWTSRQSGGTLIEDRFSKDQLQTIRSKYRGFGKQYKTQRRQARSLAKYGQSLKRTSRLLTIGSLAAIGFEMAGGLFSLGESFAESRSVLNQSTMSSYSDTAYYDSRRAMTQRQRAIQAIHSSQLSTRVAFGNEASYMHY